MRPLSSSAAAGCALCLAAVAPTSSSCSLFALGRFPLSRGGGTRGLLESVGEIQSRSEEPTFYCASISVTRREVSSKFDPVCRKRLVREVDLSQQHTRSRCLSRATPS